MMWKPQTLYARTSALPAIFAALALTSTSALAQEAQPVTTDPPPATSTTTPPATTTDTTPATTDTATAAPDTTTETAAPAAAARAVRTTRATTRVAAARPATTTHTVTRTTTTHAVAPAPAPAAAAPASAPAAPQSAVTPVVDTSAQTAPAPAATAAKPAGNDETLPIAAGGVLALIALGGGAFALSRRRRDAAEDEWFDDESLAHEPVDAQVEPEAVHEPMIHEEQPAIVAPSAFAWGNERQSQERDADDDRLPGESWVERAYRGPTPNNPSVSLKARLKRAAFFDKRERDVAAGKAEPVDMDAGLPDAMVEEQERELA